MNVELFATPDQIKVIECEARYIGLAAGRRWGKTMGAIIPKLIKKCLDVQRADCAYIAPSHKLSRMVFDMVCDNCRPLIKRTNAQFPFFVKFWNDSRIDFYSFARPKTIRGSGYDLVVVDEIQEIKDPDTFWATLRPLVSDRQGSLMVAGQFRGKNWFYDAFFRDAGWEWDNHTWTRTQGKPGHTAFIFTAQSGIMYDSEAGRAEIEDAKSALPRVIYEQEYECIPTANRAAVFHPDDLDAARRGISKTEPSAKDRKERQYIAGIDLGAHRDHAAIVILELPGPTVVFSEELPVGLRHEEIAFKFGQIARRFGALPVVDVTGGATGGKAPADSVLKYYRAQLPNMRAYTWNRENKMHAVRLLSTLFEKRQIQIPEIHRTLREELGLYEFEYKEHYYLYHGPKGARDDLVSALALAVDAWDRGWSPSASPVNISQSFV